MAQYTTNYKLYKPNRQDSEPVDSTLKDNFETIDYELKQRETDIEDVSAKVSTFQEQVNNMILESGTSDAETIQARGTFPLLNDRLNAVDGDISDNESSLQKLVNYKNVNKAETEYIAHRGLSGLAPENTIPAFQLAISNSFESIECDVQITKDGYPVVIHDTTVDRTTNGTGNVKDLTLMQLQALDASNDMTFFAGTKIPLMDDYLKVAKGNSKYIYPEIKGYRTQSDISIIVNKIKEHGMENRCVIQSFTATDLDVARTYSDKVILGYLASTRDTALSRLDMAQADGNAVVLISSSILLSNPDLFDLARDKGIDVIAWTVDNSRDIQKLKTLGVVRFMMNHLRRS